MKTLRTLYTTTSFGALLVAALVVPQAANAEPMDYGALQDLFGEPITVSATGTPQRASDVAANMTIITADQIRQAGSRSIPEVIGVYVPGVDVIQQSGGSYDVGVRGYQQNFQPRMQVLIDGRQVFLDDYSRMTWNNLPVNIDDIRQIEVVKGPASAIFGSNAASGTINIVTYSANYDNDRVLSVFGGTQGRVGADATATVRDKWGGLKISAGTHDSNEFSSKLGAFDQTALDPKQRYVSVSTVFNVSSAFHLNFESTFSESRQNTGIPTGALAPEESKAYSFRGGFDWKTKIGTIVSDTYYNRNSDGLGGVAPAYFGTSLLVSKLEDRFTLGSHHTFRVGLEYRSKQLSTDNANAFAVPVTAYGRLNEDAMAGSLSWLWQISDKLSWTNAVRFDHMSMEQDGIVQPTAFFPNSHWNHGIDAWSANSGISYKVTPNDAVRVTYGRGIIMPSMLKSGISLTSSAPTPNTFISTMGNPWLSPSIVQNVEIGYDHRFASISSVLKTSVFYTHNHDLFGTPLDLSTAQTYVTGGQTFIVLPQRTAGGSKAVGAEIELQGQSASGFRWDASYSYSHVEDQAAVDAQLGYSHSTPEHHARLSLGYTKGPFEADVHLQYLSQRSLLRQIGQLAIVPVHTGGYVTLGGRIAYTFADKYVLAVSATELNDDDLQQTSMPKIERQVLASLTSHF